MAAQYRLIMGPQGDLRDWSPADHEYFGVRIQVILSPPNSTAQDSFDGGVCTPRWFADRFDETELRRWASTPLDGETAFGQLTGTRDLSTFAGVSEESAPLLFGRGIIFMRRWDYAKLKGTIQELCARAEGPDWPTAAGRISRYVPWEFDPAP
jgi:hypothetical protein